MIWLKIRIDLKRLNLISNKSLNSFKSTNRFKVFINPFKLNYSTNQQIQSLKPIRKQAYERNTIVYELKSTSFLVTLLFAGYSAFLFWCCLGMYVQNYKGLHKVIDKESYVGVTDLNYSRGNAFVFTVSRIIDEYSTLVSLICFIFGGLIGFGCQRYVISSVKSITLLKGGQDVIVNIFRGNPLSTNYKPLHVTLRDLCFHGSRTDKQNTISLSIRKHRGKYILDKKGEFDNQLFDRVVGLHRDIAIKK